MAEQKIIFFLLDWNEKELFFNQDMSELFQHEYDHLDGILAVARAIDGKSFALRCEKKKQGVSSSSHETVLTNKNEKTFASKKYLDDLHIPYQSQSFPQSTEKGAGNVARALGFRERQMVKTLIFQHDKGEAALIMVGGDQNAISGLLKKVLNSRNISMCSPERVKTITGYEVGSIPPFHWQPPGFRSFIDASLMSEELLGVGTGSWGEEILIKPQHLAEASKALIVNLTDRKKPALLAGN